MVNNPTKINGLVNFNTYIMKTLKDLFDLILEETELNKGKIVNYLFDINTQYKWVSMYEKADIEDGETKTIINSESIATEPKLQLIYWTIYNKGRVQYKNQ